MWIKFAKASSVTSFILSFYSALLDLEKTTTAKKTKKKKQFRRTVQMDLITWKHFLSGASTQLQFLDNVALKILKTKFLV